MKKSAQLLWFLFVLCFISLLGSRILIGHWVDIMWIPFVGIFVFGLLACVSDLQYLKESLKSHKTRQIIRVSFRASLFAVLLVLLGAVVQKLNIQWDLSYSQMNTTSKDAEKALRKISKEIQVIAFFKKDQDLGVKENFRLFSKRIEKDFPLIKFSFVEATGDPKSVEKYSIKKIPSFVIASQDNFEVLNSWSEELIVNTITKVHNNKKYNVCNMTGFGEMPSQSTELYSISHFSKMMESSGYLFQDITELFFVKNSMDCDLLLIASPKKPYPEILLLKMKEYFRKGKPILVAIDPGKAGNLGPFLKEFDIQYYNNYIIDLSGEKSGFNAATVIGSKWNANTKIGQWLTGKAVVFPVSSQMEILDEKDDLTKQAIVSSEKESFVKPELSNNIIFKPGIDTEGSFPIGILVEQNKNRIAVFSDADFLSNDYISFQGNRELSGRLLSYLIRSEEDINLAPKSFYREHFILTPIYAKSFLLGAVLPVPFILFGLSFWLWFRRRRL
jgi:hypothetical protein